MEQDQSQNKIDYVKPAILDLGHITPTFGNCAPCGDSDSNDCTDGSFAGDHCVSGSTAAF